MVKHRRSHKRRGTTTTPGIGSLVGKAVEFASPFVQFVQQITEKDLNYINANLPAGTVIDPMDQAKNIVNIIVSKMTGGFNPFKDAYQGTFKLNYTGFINKWVAADAAMIIYGEAGKRIKWLPKAALVGRIGKKSILAAAAAGVLDTPTTKAPSGQVIQFNKIPSLGSNQQGGIAVPQGIRSSSGTSYTLAL